jgi:hypothetical protein
MEEGIFQKGMEMNTTLGLTWEEISFCMTHVKAMIGLT